MSTRQIINNGVLTPADHGLDVNSMRPFVEGQHMFRANALLRRYEWEMIDEAVVDVARNQLVITEDLRRFGLVKPLGGLGTIYSTYEKASDMTAANIDMSADTEGDADSIAFTPVSIPVPIIHKPFQLNARRLAASRNAGESLDVTNIRTATRRVGDALENMIFNGASLKVDANAIYGLTTHPDRSTDTATNYGGGDWSTEGNAYKTIAGMIQALWDSGFQGPFGCYAAMNLAGNLWNYRTDGSGRSEAQTIVEGLRDAGLSYIKPAASLASSTLVVFQLTSDVIDLGVAQEMVAVQWDEKGQLVSNFKVMTAAVPRVKSDANGACGVAHATGA
jgi:uncharacterized linocin/CFP29 family protein